MRIFTIGFVKKNAEEFFGILIKNGVKRIIDVRLNNTSQLAGYTKRDDLKYFLKAIANIDYIHCEALAPTKELLDDYKKDIITWEEYEKKYINIISERNVLNKIDDELLKNSCLLCSEITEKNCHRRLAAEYFAINKSNIEIIHL